MRRRQPLKSNKLKKWLAAPYAVWAVGFIIIPLILILYYAFTGEEGGFTLSNFAYVATKENIKHLAWLCGSHSLAQYSVLSLPIRLP